jgi:hypothetical protein
MRRLVHGVVLVLVMLLGAIAMETAPASTARPQVANARWNDRLEALRPSEPLAYFELAEEMADAASDAAQRDLARHLFALAGSLDPDRLGGSACLAMAAMESDERAKRRMLAMAALLGGDTFVTWRADGSSMMQGRIVLPIGSPAAISLAEAFGHYRRGQGARAMETLRRPGVTELLNQCDRMLPMRAARFIDECRQMRGARPRLSAIDLIRMLRLEAALLGAERTWSSDWLLTEGRPLIEVDPMRMHDALGVDASRPYFRNGRWVERSE